MKELTKANYAMRATIVIAGLIFILGLINGIGFFRSIVTTLVYLAFMSPFLYIVYAVYKKGKNADKESLTIRTTVLIIAVVIFGVSSIKGNIYDLKQPAVDTITDTCNVDRMVFEIEYKNVRKYPNDVITMKDAVDAARTLLTNGCSRDVETTDRLENYIHQMESYIKILKAKGRM